MKREREFTNKIHKNNDISRVNYYTINELKPKAIFIEFKTYISTQDKELISKNKNILSKKIKTQLYYLLKNNVYFNGNFIFDLEYADSGLHRNGKCYAEMELIIFTKNRELNLSELPIKEKIEQIINEVITTLKKEKYFSFSLK